MKNLSEKALLVNLRITQWSARAYDEEVTRQVERDHSATNAGRYTKILVDVDALRTPQRAANEARKFYHQETLPWTDNGDRILSAENYLNFMKLFRPLKVKFEDAVSGFCDGYPELKRDAKYRLGKLFKEDDYPDTRVVQSRFSIKLGVLPINNLNDFRLKVSADEVRHLRKEIEEEISFRIQEANKSIWQRVQEPLSKMVAKLTDHDATFRDSLVGNIEEVIDLIPRLNFTGDQDLKEIRESLKPLIVDPDYLRENPKLRDETATKAQAILERVSDFLA